MIKGWTNIKRLLKLGAYSPNIIFPTFQYLSGMKAGLDVQAHSYMGLIGSDTIDSVSTSKIKENATINTYVVAITTAAAHGLKRGDIVKFTSGSSQYREQRVLYVSSTTKFYLSEPILSTEIAAGNTFNKYRDARPVINTTSSAITTTNIPLDIVDQLDSSDDGDGILRPDITTIPKRSSNAVEVVNSLAATCYEIQTIDDIGEYMALYSDAARANLICFLPIAGGKVQVTISAGTTIYLGAVKDTADITTADTRLIIQFLG